MVGSVDSNWKTLVGVVIANKWTSVGELHTSHPGYLNVSVYSTSTVSM